MGCWMTGFSVIFRDYMSERGSFCGEPLLQLPLSTFLATDDRSLDDWHSPCMQLCTFFPAPQPVALVRSRIVDLFSGCFSLLDPRPFRVVDVGKETTNGFRYMRSLTLQTFLGSQLRSGAILASMRTRTAFTFMLVHRNDSQTRKVRACMRAEAGKENPKDELLRQACPEIDRTWSGVA